MSFFGSSSFGRRSFARKSFASLLGLATLNLANVIEKPKDRGSLCPRPLQKTVWTSINILYPAGHYWSSKVLSLEGFWPKGFQPNGVWSTSFRPNDEEPTLPLFLASAVFRLWMNQLKSHKIRKKTKPKKFGENWNWTGTPSFCFALKPFKQFNHLT